MDNSKNQKYNLDDILSEIKRKKLERESDAISSAQQSTAPIISRSSIRSSEETAEVKTTDKFSINQVDEIPPAEQVFSKFEDISASEEPSENNSPVSENTAESVPENKTAVFTPISSAADLDFPSSDEFSVKSEDSPVGKDTPVSEEAPNTRVTYFDESVKASAEKKLLADDRQIKIDDTLHQYFGADAPSTSKKGSFYKPAKKSSAQTSVDPTRHIDLSSYQEAKKNRISQPDEVNEATIAVSGDSILKGEVEVAQDNTAKTQVVITPEPIEVPKVQKNADEEPQTPSPELIDEYVSPSQAKSILKDLENQKVSLIFRLVLTALLFAGSLYLSLSAQLSSGLPEIISFAGNSAAFIIINVILLCVAILVCNATVGGGLIALFRLKADSDTLTACSVLASLVHGIALAISPDFSVPPQNLYFSVGILALTLNTVGKLSMANRIIRNFKFINEESPACVLSPLSNKNTAKTFSGKSDSSYNIAYCSENEFFSNFLELSYGDDFSDSICRTVSPLILAAALLISALTLVISSNILTALTCLSALLAAAAPFTCTLAANLPFASANKNLLSYGAVINGFDAVDTFDSIDCVMLDASDIFTKESVVLHGIKTFSKVRIDEAIVDAASVITQTKSALYGTFDKVIAGNTAMLKEVDSLVYEDGMGLSAWVNSQRVLIGNRTLMMNHGIDVPSTDFEARNVAANQNALYLSNSGELTAMFILEYKASKDAFDAFKNFKNNGISIIVNSTDPNITPELISKLFDFPEDMINVIPANLHREFNTLTSKKKASKGYAAYDGKLFLTAKLLSDSTGIKKRVSALLLMQIISIFIACAFITFFAFSGNINNIGYLLIIIYQLFWTAFSFLISIIGWK